MRLKRKAMERRDKNDNIKKKETNDKKKRRTSSPRAGPIPPRLSKLASHLEKIICKYLEIIIRPTFDNDDNQCLLAGTKPSLSSNNVALSACPGVQ